MTRTLMTCEETRPVLNWECKCQLHSTNAYVLKHKVYLPVHLLVSVISLVRVHLDDLKAETLQLEALVAKEVKRQQLQQQQELKRKADEQEKDEEAKKPRVEEPAVQAAAPATGGFPQFALTEEAFRRIAEMVTQNLLQTMPMLGQLGPVPAPVVGPVDAPRVDQSDVMAGRQEELGDMQAAARERRVAQVAEGLKKADDMENPGDSGKGSK